MTERKYVLTKLGKGDYLLPSNDKETIWRIGTYEDGPTYGLDWPRDLTLWALWRWRAEEADVALALDTWESWDRAEDGFKTRAEAIDAAMRAAS